MRVESSFLTFSVYSNSTFLCNQVYPVGPDTVHPIIPPSCSYGPGPLAFGASIPLNATYGLGTIWTTIRLVDPSSSAKNIACVRVAVSPYYKEAWYWSLFFWFPISLAIVYFVVGFLARVVTSVWMRRSLFKNRAREGKAPTFISDSVSPTVISVFSSQGLVSSPALLRFATPGLWDIILHTQWVALLGTFAVKWPEFVYPIFRQGAWATLLGNVTYVQENGTEGRYNPVGTSFDRFLLADPKRDSSSEADSHTFQLPSSSQLATNAQLPTSNLGNQIATNVSSPLYMNTEAPNVLLNLGGSRNGLEAFAKMIGLQPQDLFGTCLAVWAALVAAILAFSALIFVLDLAFGVWTGAQRRREDGMGFRSSQDFTDAKALAAGGSDKRGSYGFLGRSPVGMSRTLGLHWKALHGNLVRALVLFHLPIVLFSTYQIAEHDQHTLTSVALAGLVLALLGILAPAYFIWRLSISTTQKLYDDIGTLLSLGPLYNTYSPGSQLFCVVIFTYSIIVGISIGAAQSSAAAQTIIVLLMEILLALASSLWLPWGDGAMQGPLSFLISVFRIITAVLLVLLTPLVGLGHEANSWISYVILLLAAIFFVAAALVLVAKVVEALIRVFWKVPFDERASRNAGIGGVIRRIRRRKYKTVQLSKSEKRAKAERLASTQGVLFQSSNIQASGATSPGNTLSNASGKGGFVPRGTHSRQNSYASYLEAQLYGQTPRTPMEHHLSENSPYSAYLRGDPNDEGIIMASLPPMTPGTELPVNNRNGRISPGAGNALDVTATPKSGFERLSGGKATDAEPYQSISSRNGMNGAIGRHTASSSSGTDVSYFADPRSSFHALNGNSAFNATKSKGGPQDEFSSTALAQRSATINGRADGETKAKRGGVGGFWRKRGAREEESSSEDEDEVWNGYPSERGHGPWQGIAKMGGAFAGFKNRLGVGKQTKDDDNEEGDSLPPNPSPGFQVVRQARPSRGNNGNAGSSNEVSPSNSRPISKATEAEDQDVRPRPPPFGSKAAIALEAAASSAHGHGDGEGRPSTEDRYWLPPGAAPPAKSPERSETRQRRKSRGMQAVWQQEDRPKSQIELEALENRRDVNKVEKVDKPDNQTQQNQSSNKFPTHSLDSDRFTNSSTSRLAKAEPMSAEVHDAEDALI